MFRAIRYGAADRALCVTKLSPQWKNAEVSCGVNGPYDTKTGHAFATTGVFRPVQFGYANVVSTEAFLGA